jgi:hypothetical protein
MARQEITTCENPLCGKDITQGDGRMTRMIVMSEVIAQKPYTTQKHDAGTVLQPMHFCDILCTSAWAADQAAKWVIDEEEYQKRVEEANNPQPADVNTFQPVANPLSSEPSDK